jgi:hypothetical protein
MSKPENPATPAPERNGHEGPFTGPVNVIMAVEGVEDTTVRPTPNPQQLPMVKEELARLMSCPAGEVILVEGVEDATVRPRDPNVPIFWPDDIPLPGKGERKPPEPPAKLS